MRVLYIRAVSENDALFDWAEADFENKYGAVEQRELISVQSLEDMERQLKALPKDSQFDRIELLIHGRPGEIRFPDQTPIDAKAIQKQLGPLDVAAPDAELRVISCQAAAKTFSGDASEELLDAMGSALLPGGGKVYASPRLIHVPALGRGVERARKAVGGFFKHVSGTGAVINLGVLVSQLPRGILPTAKVVAVREIQPRSCVRRSLEGMKVP